MLTWLSRIMIAVFTLNILAPDLAFAGRASSRSSIEQAVSARISNQHTQPLSYAKSLDELDELYIKHMIELLDAYDTIDITDSLASHNALAEVVEKMHRTEEEYAAYSKMFNEAEKKNAANPEDKFMRPVEEPVAQTTYRSFPAYRAQAHDNEAAVAQFLDKVAKNQFSIMDLVEDMDPLKSQERLSYADEQISTYAAEIILNTLNGISTQAETADWMEFLPRLQQRALYRLNHLPNTHINEGTVMARGTLRMLLSRIHQIYELAGRRDPNLEYSRYMRHFLSEIKELKENKNTKQGRAEFQFLKLQTEYTTTYAVLNNHAEALEELVNILEEKPAARKIGNGYKATKFQTQYSPILGTLFATMTDTLKAFPVSTQTAGKMLALLVKMSGPEHATDTRVLAISAASLLNRSTSGASAYMKAQLKGKTNENFYEFTPKQREVLARYAVDIYHPLTNSGIYGMQTYGLDSHQMRVLANSLGTAIQGLLPVSAPKTVWNSADGAFVAQPQVVSLTEFDTQTSLTHNGKSLSVPTYMFGSDGRVYPVYNKNVLNRRKVEQEDTKVFASVIGEAALWLMLGPIVSYTFRALRMTAGAVSFLPRAVKVARQAKKGQKLGRFTAKMRQGFRYSGKVDQMLARSGVTATATRIEKVTTKSSKAPAAVSDAPALGSGGAAAGRPGPKAITIDAPVTRSGTTYVGGFTNQEGTASWGRRLWQKLTGKSPQVDKYNLFGQRPGYQFASAEIDAASLGIRNGINTPLQKARFLRAAQQQGVDLTPLSWAQRGQVMQEKTLMGAIDNAFKLDATSATLNSGKFDYWAYNGTTFERVTPQDFFARVEQLQKGGVDYYAVLKVSPSASAAEIKGAYHKLAKELHPDKWASFSEAQRAFAEEKFKQLGEAYKTLGNQSSRAAYDLKLSTAKGVSSQGFVPQMPVSPEGYSLAITPKQFSLGGIHVTGMHTPGYNPISHGGLGINAKNVSEDLSYRMVQLMGATGQIPDLGGLLIKSNPLLQMFKANVVFFAAWDALDRGSYAVQEPMIAAAANKQVDQELDRYGDTYRAKPGAQADNSPRLDVLDRVSAQTHTPMQHQGALLTLPFYAARLGMGNLTLVSDEIKSLLAANAKRIELNKALRKQPLSAFKQNLDASLQEIVQAREEYELLAQEEPALAADLREISQFLRQYEQDIKNLANSKASLSKKTQQFEQITQANSQLFETKQARLNNKALIMQLEQGKASLKELWLTLDQEKKIAQIYDQAIAELKKSGKQANAQEMTATQEKVLAEVQQRLDKVLTSSQPKQWDQMNTKEKRQALRGDWQSLQEVLGAWKDSFTPYGPKAEAEFNQLVEKTGQQVNALLKNSRISVEEQATQYYQLANQLEADLVALQNKYASQKSAELEELLPEEEPANWRWWR